MMLTLLLILLSVLTVHLNDASIDITIASTTVTIAEQEDRIQEIAPITCSDTDGDLTRVFLQSLTPSQPCGKCFTVEPCGSTKEDFCLVFRPGQGQLSFNQVSSYSAYVVCTDDVDTPATGTILIRVVRNLPPKFNPPGFVETNTSDYTKDMRQGDVINTVGVTDDEGDVVYFSMETQPVSNLFSIGYTSGVIKAADDLRYLCSSPVSFYVNIWDQFHGPVGPKVIQISFLKINTAPVIGNLDHTVNVAENAAINSTVLTITVTDTTLYSAITLSMTSLPAAGMDIYKIVGKQIQVRRELDYEYLPLREVTLNIWAFDGFCYSENYVVRVVITDVNEPLAVLPIFMQPTFNESFVKFQPNLTLVDQDEGEVFTYKAISGAGSAKLAVEASTGLVTSTEFLDVEPKDRRNFPITIEVSDSAAHKDRFEVNFTIIDINDNVPFFNRRLFEFKVTNCTQPGKVLGQVFGDDLDSSLHGNNLYFFSGGGSNFAVLSGGSVLYTSLLPVGAVDTGSAYITDQGLYPGALSGTPAVVTVTCDICPTTAAPPTTTPTTAATTTLWTGPRSADASEILRLTDTSTNDRRWGSNNVDWLAAGSVLLVGLAVSAGLVCRRLCSGVKPLPRHLGDTLKSTAPQQTSSKAAATNVKKAPQPRPKQLQIQEKPPTQQPQEATQQQSQPQLQQQHQEPQTQQQPQAWTQQKQNSGLASRPIKDVAAKPRAEIPAIADSSQDVAMFPPHISYPRVFNEVEAALIPAQNNPKGETTRIVALTDKVPKVKVQAKDGEGQTQKPQEEATETPRNKPRMRLGEQPFELEILTPRNSPLPLID